MKPAEIAGWTKAKADLEGNIWVAYLDGKPAGYACCQMEAEQDRTTAVRFTETKEGPGQSKIAVLPEYRRKGVASALVNHAMKDYARRGATRAIMVAYSDNHDASRLAESLGFKKEDQFAVIGVLDLQRPLPPIQPNPEVNVRKLEQYDLEAITTIIRECRPDLHESFSMFEQIKDFYTRPDPWAEISLVAEYCGDVVGIMDFTSEGLIGIGGVLPRVQKLGIGSTLFHRLLAMMQARGKKMALVDTGSIYPDAIRMYERFGFDTSRQQWDWTRRL